MSKYIDRFLSRDNGMTYQSRVGHWPKYEFLTKNSIELAEFMKKHNLLQDDIKISPQDSKLLDSSSKNIIKDFLIEFEKMSNITKENLEKTLLQ